MIQVGSVKIDGNIALSPMAGISDSPYRQITRRLGSAFSYTEFVSTDQIVLGNQKSIDMLRFQESERPITFQIFGSKLNHVVEAAKRIEELRPDIIDLNMGCSVSKVSHSGSGAGLLKNLKLASSMIEGIKKSVKVPVTAKIRLGWDEASLNYLETIKILEESGVSAISVHGRTKSMGYAGIANWDAIGEIKSKANVPIFGNGDITSYEDAKDKLKKYKVDLVLIGRKAIGNPWIFDKKQKSDFSFEAIRKVMVDHLMAMNAFYPSTDEYALILFRKHFVRYMEGIDFPISLRTQLLQTKSINEFINLIGEYNPAESPGFRNEPLLTEPISCESFLV